MKANELIVRQDRVVYTLMLLLAGLGLVWSFWERHHQADLVSPTSEVRAATQQPAPANTVYVR